MADSCNFRPFFLITERQFSYFAGSE